MKSAHILTLARAFAAAAILIIVVAGVVLQPGADNASDLVRYAGRFHILALHVPIGVLVLALMAEPLTLLKKYRRTGDLIVGFALPLLVLTGLTAILLGLALAHGSDDYPTKLVSKHRNLTSAGIAFAALAMIAWPYRRRFTRWPHRALLFSAATLMSIGAHFGGSLTHGADYLFAPLEPKAKPSKDTDTDVVPDDAGTPLASTDAGAGADGGSVDTSAIADAGVADASVAHDAGSGPPKLTGPKAVVQSMFARRCAPCHTTNAKGGLRLSLDPSKMKAGEAIPGNVNDSRIYTRLTLPKDDEYHMPPEKEAQPTAGEIAAVKQWLTDLK